MTEFDILSYWEKRYHHRKGSGPGSRHKWANRKARYVNDLIQRENVRSVIDWGCGDGRISSRLKVPFYVGLEVSETALALCAKRVPYRPGWSWRLYDGWKLSPFPPPADLALSLDVIFHLVDDEMYQTYITLLFGSAPLVCVHSSNRDEAGRAHVLHRTFVDDVPPNFETSERPAEEEGIGWWLFRRR